MTDITPERAKELKEWLGYQLCANKCSYDGDKAAVVDLLAALAYCESKGEGGTMPSMKRWAVFGRNHALGNNSVFMSRFQAEEAMRERRNVIASFGDIAYLNVEPITVTWAKPAPAKEE